MTITGGPPTASLALASMGQQSSSDHAPRFEESCPDRSLRARWRRGLGAVGLRRAFERIGGGLCRLSRIGGSVRTALRAFPAMPCCVAAKAVQPQRPSLWTALSASARPAATLQGSARAAARPRRQEQHSARSVGSSRAAPSGPWMQYVGCGGGARNLSPDPTGWCYSFTASAK